MSRPRRVLTFTSLFPSSARPRHGIFVQTRLLQLLRAYPLDVRVVTPVPWFPFEAKVFGEYAKFAATPRHATLENGLQVSYPRYLMVPKLGVTWQPDAMARAALGEIERLRRTGWEPDVIDAHYFYPDGVAAAIVADRLDVPVVITARGSDVNVLAHMPRPRRRIQWAAQRAGAVITVSSDLKKSLLDLGVAAAKLVVLRNGVDSELFGPVDRDAARARLGLGGRPVAVCVGNLVDEKGFTLAIDALSRLNDWELLIVGEGPARGQLAAHANRAGIGDRIRFHRNMPQSELTDVYGAADVLLLTSTREGWPNVLLEAMACGTPVVAVDVGAVSEIVTDDTVGRIVPVRDAGQLAAAIDELMRSQPDRARVRAHACQFDWTTISSGQWDVLTRVLRPRTSDNDLGAQRATA